jgi:hypothetical protein
MYNSSLSLRCVSMSELDFFSERKSMSKTWTCKFSWKFSKASTPNPRDYVEDCIMYNHAKLFLIKKDKKSKISWVKQILLGTLPINP